MSLYPRYALYFVPPADNTLYRFGADLLGYDSYRACDCVFPDAVTGRFQDWREMTSDPRKYGFHATLKAPFALRPDASESDLLTACDAFAEERRPVPVIAPVVNAIGDFIAIVPAEPNAALAKLASDCVSDFDSFRAPMTPEDRARRNPEKLTDRQVQHLDRWGYPYVFDDFRFHMTLTGRLQTERREIVVAYLRERFAQLSLTSVAVDRIALCRQNDRESRFTILGAFSIAG